MPIQFIAERRIFKMDTADSTYVMQIDSNGYLLHHYYGEKIADFDLAYLSYTCRYKRLERENKWNKITKNEMMMNAAMNRRAMKQQRKGRG